MVTDSQKAKAMNRLVDKPFCLGDLSKGFDCINSIRSYYEELGCKFPEQFEGYTWDNYAAEWDKNPSKSRDVLIRFLCSLGVPVKKNYYRRGDLLILQGRSRVEDNKILKKIVEKTSRLSTHLGNELREIAEGRRLIVFPAIYLGNGHIFAVFDIGCKVLPFRIFKENIREARRLINV